MIQVVKQFVPKEPFIFLVSSGVDSIAAAHWLKFHYRKDFKLLHFNHNCQEINDEMENSVIKFAQDFQFGCYLRGRDTDSTPAFTDTSENGLREWRHHILRGIGGRFISAHHLNDAVESWLFNILQGHNEYNPIPWHTTCIGFSLYHPFLKTKKQDFIDYAIENDLMKYVVEDPTNHDLSNNRSWMREKLMPVLDERQLGLEKIVKKKFYNI